MIKTAMQWRQKLRTDEETAHRHQQGQSLVIVVVAFIGILALVGLGIDLSLVYTERVKTSRAADAAALAAASELPLESAAHDRALVYLQDNGYDYTAADVEVVYDSFDTSTGRYSVDPDAETVIWIDTAYAQDPNQGLDSADRIRVRVRQNVWMTFMQFVGFSRFPVDATAEAENISNIDTVIVYDESGSMEFDTLCYGCWEGVSGQMYPDGDLYPLHWSYSTVASADHCAGWNGSSYNCGSYQYYNSSYEYNNCNWHHRSYSDRYYTVIEGEEYSRLSADYHTWGYTPYYTFWVIQHNGKGAYYRNPGSIRGAYLSHHPFYSYSSGGLGVPCTWAGLTDPNGPYCRHGVTGGPFPAPRADYDFYAPSGDEGGDHDDYYIWVRGQGGQNDSDRHLFWGMDGAVIGEENYFPRGASYDGANSWDWDWRCLGRVDNIYQGTHTLNLWAGGAGFDVDRIVIQTRDNGACNNDSSPPDSPDGYAPNNGRTDWACSPCDPRFAGRPGGQTSPPYRPDCNIGGNPDQRRDAIYDDEQPIRNALEAAKHFVGQLDPRFDQIGYVRYDTNVVVANELECLRRRGVESLDDPDCNPNWSDPGEEPPRDPDCGCFSGVITNTVLYELDRTRAGGSTNIAGGMLGGIDVLSTQGGHYGRPGAAHVMVLMTDGEANVTPNSYCDDDPNLWPNDSVNAKDCVMYYAHDARDNAIVVYTISLGWGADRELMEAVADTTGGFHRWAPTSDKLDAIFEELFKRIFLRLIG
ncbi:MAG: hypothetical protein DRI81_00895 [Chloroflexi bacterium]|nr:MAG: hypothetical protein DRI81_00895 [Chloroflexota bacterium]